MTMVTRKEKEEHLGYEQKYISLCFILFRTIGIFERNFIFIAFKAD